MSKACGVEPDVPVIVVWGRQQDVETAVREVAIRAREATAGRPQETRQALDDGTNGFERILPGADRMYPDTDLPPIPLEDDRVAGHPGLACPQRPGNGRPRLLELGVGADLAERLSRHRAWDLFAHLADRLDRTAPARRPRSWPRCCWTDPAPARPAWRRPATGGTTPWTGSWPGRSFPRRSGPAKTRSPPRLDETEARADLRRGPGRPARRTCPTTRPSGNTSSWARSCPNCADGFPGARSAPG